MKTRKERLQVLLLIASVLLIVFPLIIDSDTWGTLFESAFSWVPDHPPQPLEAFFGMLMMPFLMFHGFSFMIGTTGVALLAWLAVVRATASHPIALRPLVLPLLSVSWLAAQSLPFLQLSRGTPIRPMGWALYVGMAALALTALSVANTITEFKKGSNRIVCVFALVLSLLVITVPSFALRSIAEVKGLILEP